MGASLFLLLLLLFVSSEAFPSRKVEHQGHKRENIEDLEKWFPRLRGMQINSQNRKNPTGNILTNNQPQTLRGTQVQNQAQTTNVEAAWNQLVEAQRQQQLQSGQHDYDRQDETQLKNAQSSSLQPKRLPEKQQLQHQYDTRAPNNERQEKQSPGGETLREYGYTGYPQFSPFPWNQTSMRLLSSMESPLPGRGEMNNHQQMNTAQEESVSPSEIGSFIPGGERITGQPHMRKSESEKIKNTDNDEIQQEPATVIYDLANGKDLSEDFGSTLEENVNSVDDSISGSGSGYQDEKKNNDDYEDEDEDDDKDDDMSEDEVSSDDASASGSTINTADSLASIDNISQIINHSAFTNGVKGKDESTSPPEKDRKNPTDEDSAFEARQDSEADESLKNKKHEESTKSQDSSSGYPDINDNKMERIDDQREKPGLTVWLIPPMTSPETTQEVPNEGKDLSEETKNEDSSHEDNTNPENEKNQEHLQLNENTNQLIINGISIPIPPLDEPDNGPPQEGTSERQEEEGQQQIDIENQDSQSAIQVIINGQKIPVIWLTPGPQQAQKEDQSQDNEGKESLVQEIQQKQEQEQKQTQEHEQSQWPEQGQGQRPEEEESLRQGEAEKLNQTKNPDEGSVSIFPEEVPSSQTEEKCAGDFVMEKCRRPVNLVMFLDSSEETDPEYWPEIKHFTFTLATFFNMTKETKISILSYGSQPSVPFTMDQKSNMAQVEEQLTFLPKMNGKPDPVSAVYKAAELLFENKTKWGSLDLTTPNVPKILLLLENNLDKDHYPGQFYNIIPEMKILQQAGVSTVLVRLQPKNSNSTLPITMKHNSVYTQDSLESLLHRTSEIGQSICDETRCNKPVDVMVALDFSKSLDKCAWKKVINFLRRVADTFILNNDKGHFAVLDFLAGEPEIRIPLFSSKEQIFESMDLLEKMDKVPNIGDTSKAVLKSLEHFEFQTGQRKAHRVLLLITDQETTDKDESKGVKMLERYAYQLKKWDIDVILISLTNDINDRIVEILADERIFTTNSPDDLDSLVEEISYVSCRDPTIYKTKKIFSGEVKHTIPDLNAVKKMLIGVEKPTTYNH